jgi:ribosome biogenesis GTPase
MGKRDRGHPSDSTPPTASGVGAEPREPGAHPSAAREGRHRSKRADPSPGDPLSDAEGGKGRDGGNGSDRAPRTGIVATVHGSKCWVLDGQERVECFFRGKVLKDRSLALVVGDRVSYEPLGSGQGVVAAVESRRTELRRSVREAGRRMADRRGGGKVAAHAQDQVVLANADQAVLVVAAREPGIDLERLDRSLALARAAGLELAIVVNKMDLADAGAIQAVMHPYEEMGIPVLYLSATRDQGLSGLRERTRGRVSLFWGGSGVGKSTLSGKLTGRAIKVGVWNEKNPRGPHTTTDSCLYPLPYGGYLADTPGFDTLLLDTLSEEAHPESWLLPEAALQTARCRFANCTHRGEPGCAVKGGVLEGGVDRRRYRRYLTLASELGAAGEGAAGDEIVLVGGELFRRLRDSDRDDLVEAWTALGKTSWCYYWPFLRCYDTPNRQALWRKIGENWCLFVARSSEKGEQLNLLFPPLGPTPEEALPECLKLLRAANGRPRAKIMWLDEEDAAGLRGYRGIKLRGKGNEYWYRPEEVLSLQGRRFRTVRRQIARAESEHEIAVRPYTMADLPACLALLADWCDSQGSRYLRVLDREYTEAALRRYDRFSREELFGGVVEVAGEPRAFFLGGAQSSTVGHAFVMKADVAIPGLSYFAKRELLRWLGDHAWVNDAGDLRSEGLRQFKQSFRPAALRPIYQAVVTW